MSCKCGKMQFFAHSNATVVIPKALRRGIFFPGTWGSDEQSQRIGQVEWRDNTGLPDGPAAGCRIGRACASPSFSPSPAPMPAMGHCYTPPSSDVLRNFRPSRIESNSGRHTLKSTSSVRSQMRVGSSGRCSSPGIAKAASALGHWSEINCRSSFKAGSRSTPVVSTVDIFGPMGLSAGRHAGRLPPGIGWERPVSASARLKMTPRTMPIRRITSLCCHSLLCVDNPLFGGKITIMAHPRDCRVEVCNNLAYNPRSATPGFTPKGGKDWSR